MGRSARRVRVVLHCSHMLKLELYTVTRATVHALPNLGWLPGRSVKWFLITTVVKTLPTPLFTHLIQHSTTSASSSLEYRREHHAILLFSLIYICGLPSSSLPVHLCPAPPQAPDWVAHWLRGLSGLAIVVFRATRRLLLQSKIP